MISTRRAHPASIEGPTVFRRWCALLRRAGHYRGRNQTRLGSLAQWGRNDTAPDEVHKLDCRHAHAERMSAECRRLSEAPKGGHDNLRERALLELAAGFAKWPNNSRAAGAPPLSSGAARNNPRRRPRRAQLAACGPPSAVQPKGEFNHCCCYGSVLNQASARLLNPLKEGDVSCSRDLVSSRPRSSC